MLYAMTYEITHTIRPQQIGEQRAVREHKSVCTTHPREEHEQQEQQEVERGVSTHRV